VEWNNQDAPAKMPYRVLYHSSNVYDGKAYVIGGHGYLSSVVASSQALDVIQVFDISNNKWQVSQHKLPTARYYHTSHVIGDELFVIGGHGSSTKTSVQSLNLSNGAWSTKTASMTEPRQNHTSSMIASDKIAVFGGGSSNSVSVYYPVTNSWSQSAAAIETDNYLTSQYVGEQLHIIGGRSYKKRVAS
jgi:N-acetylneuraminic acid mutarotase